MPCSEQFAPLYKNELGHWVSATPALRAATQPQLTDADEVARLQDAPAPDWEKGGIYTYKDLQDMEEYVKAPRLAAETAYRFSETMERLYDGDGRLSLSQAFPGAPDVSQWGWLSSLWVFLDRWGSAAAILLSIIFFTRLLTWLAGLFARMSAIHKTYGFGKQLWTAFLPSFLLYLRAFNPLASTPRRGEEDPTAPEKEEGSHDTGGDGGFGWAAAKTPANTSAPEGDRPDRPLLPRAQPRGMAHPVSHADLNSQLANIRQDLYDHDEDRL
jgi:hypothetical protein